MSDSLRIRLPHWLIDNKKVPSPISFPPALLLFDKHSFQFHSFHYIYAVKITFICIGKTGKKFLEEGEQEYLNRLKHYIKLERIEIPDIKGAKKLSEVQVKNLEGIEILLKVPLSDELILLDDKGKDFTSVSFSNYLQKKMNSGAKGITFVVGGAYGFSEDVYSRSKEKISLSKMTFSHQMIRMIFFEQVYRAFTILKGEPYHHE